MKSNVDSSHGCNSWRMFWPVVIFNAVLTTLEFFLSNVWLLCMHGHSLLMVSDLLYDGTSINFFHFSLNSRPYLIKKSVKWKINMVETHNLAGILIKDSAFRESQVWPCVTVPYMWCLELIRRPSYKHCALCTFLYHLKIVLLK